MIKLGEVVMIFDLHRRELTVSAIARELGLDRKTVRRCIKRGLEAPVYGPRKPRQRARMIHILVIGAYPPAGTFDICKKSEDRKKALVAIPKVARAGKDPVYGIKGPVMRAWRKAAQRKTTTKRRASARAH